jgi:hypothetical protein
VILGDIAKTISATYPRNVKIEYLDNPRVETEEAIAGAREKHGSSSEA